MAGYSRLKISLHWLSVILVIGVYMAMNLRGLFDSEQVNDWLRLMHFNLGMILWVVMLVRFILYWVDRRRPPIIPAPPAWQEKISSLLHLVMYGCFLILPVLGSVSVALQADSWSFLGFATPTLGAHYSLAHSFKEVHEFVANLGYYLVGVHALAALYHHYYLKDNTLIRMLRR
ncbi:cytochrome b/b6 domain-containing protein [Celerinatantimonas yamalensis]|uniref:Cytochrome b/b6 domain-containing protein n=1 Tax=Celerinatantimonas yamalensis TaxID=559956 RepID=A0ABW9G8S9_9GAMM